MRTSDMSRSEFAVTRRRPFTHLRCPTIPSERPEGYVWLDVGYETNGRFVKLPFGMPIDAIEPLDVNSHNEEWAALQIARNMLLRKLQVIGAQIMPGAELEIPYLVVKMSRLDE